VRRGLEALERAAALGQGLGRYGLQAAIASCHVQARHLGETDWEGIVALYDALAQVAPSPIVDLNRAVAVSMAYGPEAALEIVDALRSEPVLAGYHLLSSVRGSLLERLGRMGEAR
jgi:predicted RNA polymerase sigma factor